jgi:hypothetical protein
MEKLATFRFSWVIKEMNHDLDAAVVKQRIQISELDEGPIRRTREGE